MSNVPSILRVAAACAIALALASSIAFSEVGVIVHSNNTASSYVVAITDDPDPIQLWDQYHPTSNSHIVLNPGGATNGDGNPSLIMSSEPGFPMASWAKKTPQGYDIVVSRFDGSAWTTPQVVAGTP